MATYQHKKQFCFLTKIEKIIFLLAVGGAGRARFGVSLCGCPAACTTLLPHGLLQREVYFTQ